ncbi:hypothetical protein ACTJLC_07975 [Paraburkholderia sp. 22099]|uniref:hypothetical protein n=1 Tax=Paraburkholderia TaxID=1822464 RepID=UPI0028578AFE|nr:hypothetical protein [Paraburkholderia terricola]MDR6492825.1 hypothetical protein [Paraburkholderia terricola]
MTMHVAIPRFSKIGGGELVIYKTASIQCVAVFYFPRRFNGHKKADAVFKPHRQTPSRKAQEQTLIRHASISRSM